MTGDVLGNPVSRTLSRVSCGAIWLALTLVAFSICFYASWDYFLPLPLVGLSTVLLLILWMSGIYGANRLFGPGGVDVTSWRLPPPGTVLAVIIVLGLVLRIVYFILADPWPNISDARVYLGAAERLLETGRFATMHDGEPILRAYRPPAYAALLVPVVGIAGNDVVGAFVLHLGLFALATIAVFALGRYVFGDWVGLAAGALFSFWPNNILYTGVAHTELFAFLLLAAGMLAFLKAMTAWRWALPAVVAGVLTGIVTLTKAPFLLSPLAWALYAVMARIRLKPASARIGVMLAAMLVVIVPWTIRNYVVLDAIVPISTNGGDVFYRSNNPLASGGWQPRGERDLEVYARKDEAEWSRKGFEWGLEWIKENPLAFAQLALHKQRIFLATDDAGAHYTYSRFVQDSSNLQRRITGIFLTWASNVWWYAMWILIAASLVRFRHMWMRRPDALYLAWPFLYFVLVHSVFESQPRYHIPGFGLLLIAAATAFLPTGHFAVAVEKTRHTKVR